MTFTDIHCHCLSAIDDGPETAEETQAMLSAALADNVSRLVATPHASPGINPFDMDKCQALVYQAQAYCRTLPGQIGVALGAEILHTGHELKYLREGYLPTLARTDAVLMEFMPDCPLDEIEDTLAQLVRHHYTPILAHIERYRCLMHFPRRALLLKKRFNAFFQVNCSTVVDGGSPITKLALRRLFGQGAIDAVASDAHGTDYRPTRMSEAYAILCKDYGVDYADSLMDGHVLL